MSSAPNFQLLNTAEPLPPRMGSYRVLNALDEGAEWRSYIAESSRARRSVIIAVMKDGKAVRTLEHLHLCAPLDQGAHGEQQFVAYEPIDGAPLSTFIYREEGLAPDSAVQLLGETASALDYLHAHGITHGGIRPSAIAVCASGQVIISPYGTPFAAPSDATEDETVYLSPEQLRGGSPTAHSDVYSLAVVAFECLTTVRPFEGTEIEALLNSIEKSARPAISFLAPNLPVAVERVFSKALCFDPSARYESAASFVTALRTALRGTAESSTSTQQPKVDLTGSSKGTTASSSFLPQWESDGSTPRSERPPQERPRTPSNKTPGSFLADAEHHFEKLRRPRKLLSDQNLRTAGIAAVGAVTALLLLYVVMWPKGHLVQQPHAAPVNAVEIPAHDDADDAVRVGELTDRQILGVLVEGRDSSGRIISALGEAEHRHLPQLVDALAALSTRTSSAAVREEMVGIATRIADHRITSYLLPFLEDSDRGVRLATAKAMVTLADRASIPFLAYRYGAEPDGQIRGALKDAVEEVAGLPMSDEEIARRAHR